MATTCSTCHGEGSLNCPSCDGNGQKFDLLGNASQCTNCHGSGKVMCGVCDGKGEIYT